MAEIPNRIKKIIDKYIKLLNLNNFNIECAYLFRSYARGNYSELSDIDIALVSEKFDGIRFSDRDKIAEITLSVSYDIEVLPFNPIDFNSDNPFVKEILSTGIKVA